MKNPKPSQTEDRRYLRFRIHSESEKGIGELVEAVWNACHDYLGTRDTGLTNFWIMGEKFDEEEQEGVIKVRRDREQDFRAAICLLEKIGGEKGFIEITETSGTLESLSH